MAVPILGATKGPPKLVICAIDFGTSRSGYGFMCVGDVGEKILTEQRWVDQPGWETSCKTLTQVLYEENTPIAWGFSAPKRLAEILEQAEYDGIELPPDKYSLLKYFKMGLRNNDSGLIQADSGRVFNAVDVVVDFLKLIWKQLDNKLRTVFNKPVSNEEIKWCLTIPAIWSEVEKASMRRAAFKAGLIIAEDVSEDHFMLVLEPEAAASWCLYERKALGQPLAEGDTFLIVDAGGGTVDLTSHKIVAGRLRECTVGTGDECGSSKINIAFWERLQLQCDDNLASLQKASPLAVLELMDEFEQQKCHVADYSATRFVKVSDRVAEYFRRLATQPAGYIQRPSKQLKLMNSDLKAIFEPIVTEVERLVREQFDAHGTSFDYIFLVGGFGSSELLFRQLDDTFAKGHNPATNAKKIIRPSDPSLAVILGAVRLGFNPELIRARKMRSTYGVSTIVEFEAGTHSNDRMVALKGKPGNWCDNVLDKFVTNGEVVEADAVVKREYKARAANQRSMSIALFITPFCHKVIYTDGANVRKLGEIIVNMADTTGGLARTVEVQMFVGQSDLKVTAIEGRTHKKYDAVIKFESRLFEYTGPEPPLPESFHIIFINDVSFSMATADALPRLAWITHPNRVGALYESCHTFLQSRVGKSDLVSCIMYPLNFEYSELDKHMYNHEAWTLFKSQQVDPDGLTQRMMTVSASGMTSFSEVLGKREAIIKFLGHGAIGRATTRSPSRTHSRSFLYDRRRM